MVCVYAIQSFSTPPFRLLVSHVQWKLMATYIRAYCKAHSYHTDIDTEYKNNWLSHTAQYAHRLSLIPPVFVPHGVRISQLCSIGPYPRSTSRFGRFVFDILLERSRIIAARTPTTGRCTYVYIECFSRRWALFGYVPLYAYPHTKCRYILLSACHSHERLLRSFAWHT